MPGSGRLIDGDLDSTAAKYWGHSAVSQHPGYKLALEILGCSLRYCIAHVPRSRCMTPILAKHCTGSTGNCTHFLGINSKPTTDY